MPHKISKWLEIAIKVFFIGLLVQFFLQTFVTYQLSREGGIWSLIWLWKELLILLFAGILAVVLFALCKKEGIKSLWSRFLQLEVFRFFVFFLVACGISFFLAVFVQKVGLGTFILSFKYNLLGFLIFLLGVGLACVLPSGRTHFANRYQKLLKLVIYVGFIWWGVIYFIP